MPWLARTQTDRMGEMTIRGLLVATLVSFVAFGLAHDLDLNPGGPLAFEAGVEHVDAIPHVEGICALTLIGVGMLFVRWIRSRLSGSSRVWLGRARTSYFGDPRPSTQCRSPGFQLSSPMLA